MKAIELEDGNATKLPLLENDGQSPAKESTAEEMPKWRRPRNLKDFSPLAFLLFCIAGFGSDTSNIINYFNTKHPIFGVVTLFFLIVPGYFGIGELMESEEIFVETRLKTTFLYALCILVFPIFNIVFKATRLFLYPRPSLEKLAVNIDRIKSLFEDSPQLSLQLYVVFKYESSIFQILAIIMSSLVVAVPNVKTFMRDIKGVRVESIQSKFYYYIQYFLYFLLFVIVSFSRAASIAMISCFLSYNALLLYVGTFIIIKVIIDIEHILFEWKSWELILNENMTDRIANSFNIVDVTKKNIVIRFYAIFFSIFNIISLSMIIFFTTSIKRTEDDLKIPIHLWISPSFQLIDWADIFIVKQNLHQIILTSLCLLNLISCFLIFLFVKPNKKVNFQPNLTELDDNVDILENDESYEDKDEIAPLEKSKIWNPYRDSQHFNSIFNNKVFDNRLSTMTMLEDPWNFVSNYVNKVLEEFDRPKIKHFDYKDTAKLLLAIMREFQPRNEIYKHAKAREVFHRCKKHYQLLTEVEKENSEKTDVEIDKKLEENLLPVPINVENKLVSVSITEENESTNSNKEDVKDSRIQHNSLVSAEKLASSINKIGMHLRVVSLGFRELQTKFRLIDTTEDDDDLKVTLGAIKKKVNEAFYKVLPQANDVVQSIKKMFSDYFEYIVNDCDKDEFDETVTEMRKVVWNYGAEMRYLEETHKIYLSNFANMEMKMTESLEKFNAVTEAYKKEILNLEKVSEEGVNLDKIVKSWNILRDLSLQLVTHKSETDLEQETKRKEAETLQEQNIMRENIALIAKAIVIPSVKKYVFSFEKLSVFFDDVKKDLEILSTKNESETKVYMEEIVSFSPGIKEACRQFSRTVIEARTDISA